MAINKALTAEFKHEASNTRKLLERLPDDKPTWRPHEKSMTLGRLATHIEELPVWIERTIHNDAFDFATASYKFESKRKHAGNFKFV